MKLEYAGFILVLLVVVLAFAMVSGVSAALPPSQPPPPAPPDTRVATPEELARAWDEWSRSAHASTFDGGQGANTTCARCKAPRNWDPYNQSQAKALDCASCKRIPGAPRPELEGGEAVAEAEWYHIDCSVCHRPVGDSFEVGIAFWNQAARAYEPVANATELCAKCHEGRHGFEVVREQEHSPAHKGWECTRCHGAHGLPSRCVDCHDPTRGRGVQEHALHPAVNCTACHDAEGLTIWLDAEAGSRHLGTYVPLRFAHTLTSWPSHNLEAATDCRRCHHPLSAYQPAVASRTGCSNAGCHPQGASLFWCILFDRDLPVTPPPNR